jgi:pyruvate/2-oxoglutarate dehydrogenase complex dihydrolipoamide dehydrogenase (E3) component
MPHFDLIIVGTGVSGRTAADEAARAGLHTAVVDCRPFGGTCALRGCEPKKILVAAEQNDPELHAMLDRASEIFIKHNADPLPLDKV